MNVLNREKNERHSEDETWKGSPDILVFLYLPMYGIYGYEW